MSHISPPRLLAGAGGNKSEISRGGAGDDKNRPPPFELLLARFVNWLFEIDYQAV